MGVGEPETRREDDGDRGLVVSPDPEVDGGFVARRIDDPERLGVEERRRPDQHRGQPGPRAALRVRSLHATVMRRLEPAATMMAETMGG